MSADMMIICKEDDSGCEGGKLDKAFFVDETSMGEPWHEFGKWFQSRFCGGPSIAEQIFGIQNHNYKKLEKADIASVKEALETMETHTKLDKEFLLKYLNSHIGKHISTENW